MEIHVLINNRPVGYHALSTRFKCTVIYRFSKDMSLNVFVPEHSLGINFL